MNVRDFTGVRAEVAASTRLPEPDVLRDCGRQRRRTHRALSVAASVVAVALLVGGVVGLNRLRGDGGVPLALITEPQRASPYGVVCDTVAYDAKDIYFVINTRWNCDKETGYLVSHSLDGGKTWQTWKMPDL